jgi:hypothetical protein
MLAVFHPVKVSKLALLQARQQLQKLALGPAAG